MVLKRWLALMDPNAFQGRKKRKNFSKKEKCLQEENSMIGKLQLQGGIWNRRHIWRNFQGCLQKLAFVYVGNTHLRSWVNLKLYRLLKSKYLNSFPLSWHSGNTERNSSISVLKHQGFFSCKNNFCLEFFRKL